MAADRAPARAYSWEPFGPGHELSTTHGAWSERKISPRAQALRAWLLEVAPWTALPSMRAEVEAWAWAEARVSLLREFVDERGELDAAGKPLPASGLLERLEATAAKRRAELGITPNAWARLVAAMSSTDHEAAARGLEALKATGRALASALPDGES